MTMPIRSFKCPSQP